MPRRKKKAVEPAPERPDGLPSEAQEFYHGALGRVPGHEEYDAMTKVGLWRYWSLSGELLREEQH